GGAVSEIRKGACSTRCTNGAQTKSKARKRAIKTAAFQHRTTSYSTRTRDRSFLTMTRFFFFRMTREIVLQNLPTAYSTAAPHLLHAQVIPLHDARDRSTNRINQPPTVQLPSPS
ncbi:unnamed protein product, partial [Ectocarpus sp. 12 AP-2014]